MATVEWLDHSIKSTDELAWLTGMAPLGVIPRIETPHDLVQKKRHHRLVWASAIVSLLVGVFLFHFLIFNLGYLLKKFSE